MRHGSCFVAIVTSSAVGLLLTVADLMPGATAQTAAEDLTLHKTINSSGMMGSGAGTATSTEYFSKNAMRIKTSNGNDTIIRLDDGKIIAIDHDKKTYSEMTFEQLKEMMDKVTARAGMSQEQIAAMKKMMGQAGESFSISKEGPGEEIVGYATEKYRIKGPIEIEVWAAPDLKIPTNYYDVMKMRLPQNPIIDFGKMYDELKKIDGIILKSETTVKMMNMGMKTSEIVTSAERGPIPASTFEVPAGYKNVPPDFP
jgi:hypothetical protein